MARVALYARKSKPPRDWAPGAAGDLPATSTEVQIRRLRAWAEIHGHDVVLEATDTATGGNPNRPGWKTVMSAVRGGHVQIVAITKLSRAMRNIRHFLDVVEGLVKRGCQLEVLDQPGASLREKDDAMSKAFRNMAATFSELERDLVAESSNEGHYIGEDGRTYGPRSDRPAGRPVVYQADEGHRMRMRSGRPRHDKARCKHPDCVV